MRPIRYFCDAGADLREGLEWARRVLADPDAAAIAASGMSRAELEELFAAFERTIETTSSTDRGKA